MSIDVTIRVPNALGKQVQRFRDRLPEALERGLREMIAEQAEQSGHWQDEYAVIEILTSRANAEQILALRPSPELQARVSELLARSKTEGLSRQEESELERHLMLEHLVRLAKARAYQQLAMQQ